MGRRSTVNVVVVGDASKLRESLADADRQLQRFGESSRAQSDKLKEFGQKALLASGVAAVGMWKAADAAADVGEATTKAQTTFGSAFGDIERFAKAADRELGQSERQALDFAASYGMIGKAAGLAGGDLSEFSMDLTKLATDFASFHNTSIPQAAEALESAFRGEFDPLQKYIPTITAATVATKALSMGLAGTTAELTAQDKILATKAFIMENAGDAMGDFARTSESAKNQQRVLRAELANLTADLGEKLMPVMRTVLSAGGSMVDVFGAIPEPIQQTAVIVGVAATGISGVAGVLSTVAGHVSSARDAFNSARDSIAEKGLTGAITPATAAVGGLTAAIGVGLAVWDAWNTNVQRVDAELKKTAESIVEMGDGALEGLTAQLRNVLDTRDSFDESFRASGLTIGDATRLIDEHVGALDQFRSENHGLLDSLKGTGDGVNENRIALEAMRENLDSLPPSIQKVIEARLDMFASGKLTANELRETVDALVDTDKAAAATAERFAWFGEQLDTTVPKAGRSAEAVRLFDEVLADDGSLTGRQEAFQRLVDLYPEAAEEAGLAVEPTQSVADAVGAVGDESLSAADALTLYQETLAGTIDPLFAAQSAADKLRSAQQKFNEVSAQTVAGTPEYETALADVAGAAYNLAQKQDELAAGIRSGDIDVGNAVQALHRWKDQGLITAAQAEETQLRFFLLALAAQELDRQNPVVTVDADTSGILWKLDEVQQRVSSTLSSLSALAASGPTAPATFDAFMGRASGGPVTAGTPYIVGEEGPELFVPGRSGTIVPNGALSPGGRAVGGGVTINVTAGVGDPVEIGRQVQRALDAYGRHGGS